MKVRGKYYGTLYFYELYFNDIDNLWLICGACNLHKSNVESLSWFRDQWLYGDEFIEYVGRSKDNGILIKTQNKKGLGEVAIAWYWDRHAHYATISKRLMQDVVTPIQILNQRVDRVVGLVRAGANERRLQRHLASLDFRLALLSEITALKGIDMPRAASESPHASSDEENYIKLMDENGSIIPINLDSYKKGTSELQGEFKEDTQRRLTAKIKREVDLEKNIVRGGETGEDPEHDFKKPRVGG